MADTNVWVSVTGSNGEEEIRLQTHGRLRDEEDGSWALFYQETDPDSMEQSETCVHWHNGRLTVLRPGDMLCTLSFVQGETFVGEYPTTMQMCVGCGECVAVCPAGALTLHLFPLQVRCRRRGNLGHIHLAYQLRLQSQLSPQSEAVMRQLDIRFTPCHG